MCGIFGILSKFGDVDLKSIEHDINKLFILSESRGKEASGLAISYKDSVSILKNPVPASVTLKSEEYQRFFNVSFRNEKLICKGFKIIGHSRLVTDGTEEKSYNNQPVFKKGHIVIHNGIITNVGDLLLNHPDIKKDFDLDTEIIPELINEYQLKNNNILQSIKLLSAEIEGTISLCLLSEKTDTAILFTNNGSLYYCKTENECVIFSSEKYILNTFLSKSSLFGDTEVSQLKPGKVIFISGGNKDLLEYSLDEIDDLVKVNEIEELKNVSFFRNEDSPSLFNPETVFNITRKDILEYNIDDVLKLKRCKKCILPETFPFVEFDENGVCNYCRSYKKKYPSDEKEKNQKLTELDSFLDKYRKKDTYDVIVPFSGGRDSSYGLSYICRELKLKPVAFTYDWGMVTDLARRNIARICGKLGVENILVSADIRKKRKYIHDNVSAWLKKPDLGMIPLFMAGDKHFFYYVNVLKKQNNVNLNIWMTNSLENTDFKSGFAGISPDFNKERIYDLTLSKNLKLVLFYWKNFIFNPSYLNSSLTDTISSYLSYYFSKRRDYLHLYTYLYWDETLIENFLISEFSWETSPDSVSTWRIGDGTAPFYNYIYYTVAGFTENDTFRSNQIREGMIKREFALDKVNRENFPRADSLKWYCDTIKLDYENTIQTINKIPKFNPLQNY
jgi:glutamine---fructose-6-phosphate transaminase (isomerizing)